MELTLSLGCNTSPIQIVAANKAFDTTGEFIIGDDDIGRFIRSKLEKSTTSSYDVVSHHQPLQILLPDNKPSSFINSSGTTTTTKRKRDQMTSAAHQFETTALDQRSSGCTGTTTSTDDEEGHQENMMNRSSMAASAMNKKLRLSREQSAFLEDSFKEHSNLNPKQKLALAKQLNLRPRQVEVWFQNRRARTKLKQTEVECDYLKRRCESLTEENKRLQKEVMELRALKATSIHPFFSNMQHLPPPTTLTLCPSCDRSPPASSSNPKRAPLPENAS